MNICVTDKVTQKTRSAPLHTLSISIKREYGDRVRMDRLLLSCSQLLVVLGGSFTFCYFGHQARGSRTIQRVEHPHTSAELRLAEAHLDSSG